MGESLNVVEYRGSIPTHTHVYFRIVADRDRLLSLEQKSELGGVEFILPPFCCGIEEIILLSRCCFSYKMVIVVLKRILQMYSVSCLCNLQVATFNFPVIAYRKY